MEKASTLNPSNVIIEMNMDQYYNIKSYNIIVNEKASTEDVDKAAGNAIGTITKLIDNVNEMYRIQKSQ